MPTDTEKQSMETERRKEKRQKLFTQKVINCLYGRSSDYEDPVNIDSLTNLSDDNTVPESTTADEGNSQVIEENISHSFNVGIAEGQDVRNYVPVYKSDGNAVASSSSDDDTETSEEMPKRRKRMRHRTSMKRKTEIEPSACSAASLKIQKDPEPLPSQSYEREQSLTKNQKRKLKKKRRDKAHMSEQSKSTAMEFTFDSLEKNSHPVSCNVNVLDKVKEFLEAVWDLYSIEYSEDDTLMSDTQCFQKLLTQIQKDSTEEDLLM